MKKIVVGIFHNSHVIVSRLKKMITNFENIIVGNTYNSANALLRGLQIVQPDVLLLDIQMPHIKGEELTAIISKSYYSVKILTITGFNTSDYPLLIMEKGVSGYILKNTDEYNLELAIKSVYKGEKYIEASIQDKINNAKYDEVRSRKPILSNREKDILQLMLEEYTNQQISEQLGISLRTVEYHRMSLIQKLNAKNVIGMVKKAFELGIIDFKERK